jgi:hypothetical protein
MNHQPTLTTVLLEVVPLDGTAVWKNAWEGRGYREFQSTPPWTFGQWLPGDTPIRITHDGPTVGYIDYAEHGLGYGDGALFGIGVVEGVPADMIDGIVQCSAEIRCNAKARLVDTIDYPRPFERRSTTKVVGEMDATRARLDGVALVDSTASITSTRCRAWPGDYRDPVDRGRWQQRTIPTILERAIAATASSARHRRPDAVRIHHPDQRPAPLEVDHAEHRHGRHEIQHSGGRGYVLAVR